MKINLRDSINHVKPHLHSVPCVITAGFRQSRYAVVTVSKDLDPETFVILEYKITK